MGVKVSGEGVEVSAEGVKLSKGVWCYPYPTLNYIQKSFVPLIDLCKQC